MCYQQHCFTLIKWIVSFFKIIFYWNIIDLQCFVSFSSIAKWISYIYVCVGMCMHLHSFLGFFSHQVGHYRILRNSLLYCSSLLVIYFMYSVCICQLQSPNLSLPLFPLITINLSLHIWLYFSSVIKFICTIFVKIPHISNFIWYLLLCLTLSYDIFRSIHVIANSIICCYFMVE